MPARHRPVARETALSAGMSRTNRVVFHWVRRGARAACERRSLDGLDGTVVGEEGMGRVEKRSGEEGEEEEITARTWCPVLAHELDQGLVVPGAEGACWIHGEERRERERRGPPRIRDEGCREGRGS
jgi:hypothetical protein